MTALLVGSGVFAKQYVVSYIRFNVYSGKYLGVLVVNRR